MKVWKPIETAPKDGRRVLLWRDGNPLGEWPFMGFWNDYWVIYIDGQTIDPTHWMPLPDPPS